MRRPHVIVATLLLAAAAGPALADEEATAASAAPAAPTAPVAPHVARAASPLRAASAARTARARGDHAVAVRAFEAAYAASCDPMLLRDIALSLEALGQVDRAISYHSRFMVEAKNASG